ncbi:MAG: glutamine--tRNA ligase/YqeY domain fusion protein [Verrucomicrobiales bacterium]
MSQPSLAPPPPEKPSLDFIRQIVADDLASGKHPFVVTRFPPEPNGYLHIGHAKAICLDFSLPLEFPGDGGRSRCHLRMDDTNPEKEEVEYVESIKEDVRWLGFDFGEHFYNASDYFDFFHDCAVHLVKTGKAYVDFQSPDEMKANRGTLTEPGTPSRWRDTKPEENLAEFAKMRAGGYPDGHCVLRAKIDLASPNLNLRDPALYRIVHAEHHHTGSRWCIYPMYDYAHPLEDAKELVTHSLCTLEFEDHRPLYDWVIENCPVPAKPRQIEFAKLQLTYILLSKRNLRRLVEDGVVDGWDDPRMPTLAALRRRGYPAEAIRTFCRVIGITKFHSRTDFGLLEKCVRDELNKSVPRYFGVLRPLKVTLTNWPAGHVEHIEAANNPERPELCSRQVPIGGELWIEHDDFMESPPKEFFRLGPGREVRLRYAFNIRCDDVVKDAEGRIVELKCTYDPESRHGGKKLKGIIHWVSGAHAQSVPVRLYDRLWTVEEPTGDVERELNPHSLETLPAAQVEPAVGAMAPGDRCQFERLGYFITDSKDSRPGAPVFNRIVGLKDSWAKASGKSQRS